MEKLLKDHNKLCVGIDLGTTNSEICTINEKFNGDIVSIVEPISRYNDIYSTARFNNYEDYKLSSVVYYKLGDVCNAIVGEYGILQYNLRPHLVAKSVKSQMGSKFVNGLSEDVPDKTPAEVQSRILKHLIKEVSKKYRCEIDDVVITVPASFDSVMCKATIDAAKLAGIKVKNDDGTDRPILLSEPNAVIYDFLNQIRNGEINSSVLDLSSRKNVLVFDFGGGTLDITLHQIEKRENCSDALKINEIATNRYTLLGGDDFDKAIAKEMYRRYRKAYESEPDIIKMIDENKNFILSQLEIYAEKLKLRASREHEFNYGDYWEDNSKLIAGGSISGTGYPYDDEFTFNEIEKILEPFMANEIKFEDYRNIENISNTRNIIYPILDVLYKASKKLETENLVVDEVILNGGMSKFYMIKDRIHKFFGFMPNVMVNPDLSVARGAAVYHYYLHKYEELKNDMISLDNIKDISNKNLVLKNHNIGIEWGKNILNDSLYLGLKNSAVHKIIPTGASLPYKSEEMYGFRIERSQNRISIPIKIRNLDGTYRTIANGNIIFKNRYNEGAYVSLIVEMTHNKIIKMSAYTRDNINGKILEEGTVEIVVGTENNNFTKTKFIPPNGTVLNPSDELHTLKQLCYKLKNKNLKVSEKSNICKRIKECEKSICNAGNPEDFSNIILNTLQNEYDEELLSRLFVISRKIGQNWTDIQKKKISKICLEKIQPEIKNAYTSGYARSSNIQAIFTLGMFGSKEDCKKLAALHNKLEYHHCCMYAHSKTRTEIKWLIDEFLKDVNKSLRYEKNYLQNSSYAIGIAFKNDTNLDMYKNNIKNIIEKLIKVIESGVLQIETLINCIIALGCICDQRNSINDISRALLDSAINAINRVEYIYPKDFIIKSTKSVIIAKKIIYGQSLESDEEEFLLYKLEQN